MDETQRHLRSESRHHCGNDSLLGVLGRVWRCSDHQSAVSRPQYFLSGSFIANQRRIIFRSLQGVGAAGAYSMSILTVYDMVPKNRLALNGVFISMAVSGATLTGPIFAGVINEHSTWRWVFFMK